MRGAVLALLLIAGCGEKAANPYPAEAQEVFARSCPLSDPKCSCSWDKITRTMTHPEYEAAMERLVRDGIPDPRLTVARTECLDAT